MNIRIIILILLALSTDHGIVRAQWISEKCPTTNDLNAICFSDSNSAWIVGNKGTILRRSGNYWIELKKTTQKDLHSVFMIDKNNGWAVGEKGTILYYNGFDWKVSESPTDKDLYSVTFNELQSGIAVGENGTIIIYEDGKWNLVEKDTHANLRTAAIVNDEILIGGGLEYAGVPIMQMHNNESALKSLFDPNAEISSMVFTNGDYGWAVGSAGAIVHFDGMNWYKPENKFNIPTLRSVFFSDTFNGICAGLNGTILTFSDNIWIKENTSLTTDLNGCSIFGNTYYAIGDSGTILTKKLQKDINALPLLVKNFDGVELYPNPCHDVLNINIKMPFDCHSVIISITSEDGQTLFHKPFNPEKGNLSCSINTSSFKSGFYLLNVGGTSYSNTKKFLVFK